ncbi:MAG: polymer-forming cytoskeletal protein [Bacteroidia bacterium]
MFEQIKKNKEAAKPNESAAASSSSINLIGNGTVIEGEIKSNGDIRIDGLIKGSVHSKSKVVLGSTGKIEGDIFCQNADISGYVKGKTTVAEMLFLKSSAIINGDIHTGKLVVEVGAAFTGSCNMGPMVKEMNSHGEKSGELHQQLKEKTA